MTSLKMFIALSVISVVSGVALGSLHEVTWERAHNNILRFKKIPAVADIDSVIEGDLSPERRAALEEELLADKRTVDIGEKKDLLFFVIRQDGTPKAVTLERFGQGFGGKLGVMVGIDVATDDLVGVGITTMSETPGVGTRTRKPEFTRQFAGMKSDVVFKVKKDGGAIDGVTGATISSRAVAVAVGQAVATFAAHREAIVTEAKRPRIAPAAEGAP